MSLLEDIEESSTQFPLERGEEGYNEAFWDKFNLFVGTGKRFSPTEIAAATGISLKTLEKYNQRISAANVPNLRRLCLVLPFEFKSWAIGFLGGNDLVIQIRRDYAELFEGIAEQIKQGKI
jgi:hypothetical protein